MALKHYDNILKENDCILAGDFNSYKIWDNIARVGNHSAVVKVLEENDIYSSYHHFFNEEQGKETRNTLYDYRHLEKGYHIDY